MRSLVANVYYHVGPVGAEQAKDRRRCADGDGAGKEDDGDHGTKQASKNVQEANSPEAKRPLELAANRPDGARIERSMDDAGVEPVARYYAPPFAALEDRHVVLGDQNDVLADQKVVLDDQNVILVGQTESSSGRPE